MYVIFVALFKPHENVLHTVYLNALLANLNARFRLREEFFSGGPIVFGELPFRTPETSILPTATQTGSDDTNSHMPDVLDH
jgi:hypothetical protein